MTTRCDSPAFPFTELVPALKSTPDPNGYRPFTVGRDEIPILHSDLPRAYQSISELAVRSQVQKKAEAFFRRLGVEIVSDDVEDLTPKMM